MPDVVEGPARSGARPLTLTIEARDAQGQFRDLLRPVVRVESSNGDTAEVTLRQTGPGRYEGSVSAGAADVVSLTAASEEPGIRQRLVIPDNAAEYRFRPADMALLETIAQTTGGASGATPEALGSTAGASRVSRRALWPALVVLALLAWLADILLRRVRVFEPV